MFRMVLLFDIFSLLVFFSILLDELYLEIEQLFSFFLRIVEEQNDGVGYPIRRMLFSYDVGFRFF